MALVVDASALVYASVAGSRAATQLRRRLREDVVHAPHLIDAELGNVLRRQAQRGDLTAEHATTVLREAPVLVDHRYGHTGAIAVAAWASRDNITFYDAIYVALAAALDIPLLTTDGRLARAPQVLCSIEMPAQDEAP